jgi:hypothetical protein
MKNEYLLPRLAVVIACLVVKSTAGVGGIVCFSLKLRHFPVMVDGGMEEPGKDGCIHGL